MVDTHVKRVAYRLMLTEQTDPDKIEMDLKGLLPESEWLRASNTLILHGRRICGARNPKCDRCIVNDLCYKRGVITKG